MSQVGESVTRQERIIAELQDLYKPFIQERGRVTVETERMPSKMSGCILLGWYEEKRKCLFYINHDQVL